MKEIRKKILPGYFEAVRTRDKNFELRKDEDDVQVGDRLCLRESGTEESTLEMNLQ